jgi:hypothetical protein
VSFNPIYEMEPEIQKLADEFANKIDETRERCRRAGKKNCSKAGIYPKSTGLLSKLRANKTRIMLLWLWLIPVCMAPFDGSPLENGSSLAYLVWL